MEWLEYMEEKEIAPVQESLAGLVDCLVWQWLAVEWREEKLQYLK